MNGTIIGHLMLKDWRLNRLLISLTLAAGLVALLLALYGGQTLRLLGSVWFFVSLCVLGSMLPGSAIVNERKKQTLAFIMSLPVSSIQYSIAKMVSIWAMFLVPWLTLLISALILIETSHIAPQGVIPLLLIVAIASLDRLLPHLRDRSRGGIRRMADCGQHRATPPTGLAGIRWPAFPRLRPIGVLPWHSGAGRR